MNKPSAREYDVTTFETLDDGRKNLRGTRRTLAAGYVEGRGWHYWPHRATFIVSVGRDVAYVGHYELREELLAGRLHRRYYVRVS